MDTFTHALSGALLARAIEPDGRPAVPRRVRMAVTFWAAAFPDSDFILRFVDPLTYLTTHRGVTHSVIMLPFWAVGLALLFWLLCRKRYPWRSFVGLCAAGIGIHIAGDVITSFGTMIFAPLSDWRAQLPATFIIDPYFTGIIVAGLLASLYWKTTRTPAVLGLVVLLTYVGVQTLLREKALAIGEAYIAAQELAPARAHALPQPFSPFHWLIVVEQSQGYHLSYVSLTRTQTVTAAADAGVLRRVHASYRPVEQARWNYAPRYGTEASDEEVARALWDSPIFARYRRFAMFPAVIRVDRRDDRACVWFGDLRFVLSGRRVPFRYAACRGASAEWKLFNIEANDSGAEVLQAME